MAINLIKKKHTKIKDNNDLTDDEINKNIEQINKQLDNYFDNLEEFKIVKISKTIFALSIIFISISFLLI